LPEVAVREVWLAMVEVGLQADRDGRYLLLEKLAEQVAEWRLH